MRYDRHQQCLDNRLMVDTSNARWRGRYRRLSKDYEYLLLESSETMIYLAMSRLMLRRLARPAPYGVPSPPRQGLRGLARAFLTAFSTVSGSIPNCCSRELA